MNWNNKVEKHDGEQILDDELLQGEKVNFNNTQGLRARGNNNPDAPARTISGVITGMLGGLLGMGPSQPEPFPRGRPRNQYPENENFEKKVDQMQHDSLRLQS